MEDRDAALAAELKAQGRGIMTKLSAQNAQELIVPRTPMTHGSKPPIAAGNEYPITAEDALVNARKQYQQANGRAQIAVAWPDPEEASH